MGKDNPIINTIGKRILVIGNSCSGKSTLAGFLASVLDVPFIELDSLNWEKNWVSLAETDPEELTRRFQKATSGTATGGPWDTRPWQHWSPASLRFPVLLHWPSKSRPWSGAGRCFS